MENPPDQPSRPISGTREPELIGCQRAVLDCVQPCASARTCNGSSVAPGRNARLIKGAGQAPGQVVVWLVVGGVDARIATAAGAALYQSSKQTLPQQLNVKGQKTMLLCIRNHSRICMDITPLGSMYERHRMEGVLRLGWGGQTIIGKPERGAENR